MAVRGVVGKPLAPEASVLVCRPPQLRSSEGTLTPSHDWNFHTLPFCSISSTTSQSKFSAFKGLVIRLAPASTRSSRDLPLLRPQP